MVCGRRDPAAHQHIPMAVAFFGDEDLAKDIAPRLGSGDTTGLDGSTAGLLGMLRS